jgi:succinate-semialdehyde dehydrogenase/glutarate-semialdehyde dehydrogenase
MSSASSDPSADEVRRLALGRPDLLRQRAYVDGEWIGASKTLRVHNPATGRSLGDVPNLDPPHTVQAVDAAHRAFPGWRERTAQDRASILRSWFEAILRHREDLARLLTAEQGKPLRESRAEVTYAASFIEWFAEEARRAYGGVIPGHQPDKRLFVVKQPVGIVAAITPWNFPAAMVTRKLAPALAAGCTVVLKPSELTPFSALALAALAEEAGVPPGVLNVVTGEPEPIGTVLTSDPRVRKFTFTGSTAVGKQLAARCMHTVKRMSLELGGNAPFIVFEDADLDLAVAGALASKFRNSGQTCVCANRLLIHESIYHEFCRRLAEQVSRFIVGDGLERETDQGPLINARAREKVHRHVTDALEKGARALVGAAVRSGPGHFYEPTVLCGITTDMLLFREETFGPVAGVTSFATEEEATHLANDTPAGLAGYVFTENASRTWRVAEALDYGMVGINTGLLSTEVAPFGGVKDSGFGREGAREGLEEYLDTKLLCHRIHPR